ncbi:hypothetical protein [Sphingobacterium siyangense]|uniref:hypothetical protein n=1 Tax=Sphingobacterium siyangense TaxID=459529 RepID=UPI001964440E|nr:hypothetical protein [Sphingobacterium siyangense]QRY58803.1 hypothetical protein JVX97_04880 [Sphingobacterium siyangense]
MAKVITHYNFIEIERKGNAKLVANLVNLIDNNLTFSNSTLAPAKLKKWKENHFEQSV